jgi:GAF domain-containing protein
VTENDTTPESLFEEFAALSVVALSQEDLPSALNELTRIAVRSLAPVEGASVTASESGRPTTVAASSDWARSLDELQYEEHEGPCNDCWRSGTIFRVRDLAEETRWPFYAPRAVAMGARSTLSLPLSSEGTIVGALNLYSKQPGGIDTQTVALAEILAAHVSMAIQVATAYFGQRDLARQLRQAMESRAVIEQAKGILMLQHKVTAEAAFELLRGASQARNTKLRDVARQVVELGTVSEPD